MVQKILNDRMNLFSILLYTIKPNNLLINLTSVRVHQFIKRKVKQVLGFKCYKSAAKTICDIVARTSFAAMEIPADIIMAMLGVTMFFISS